MADSSVGITAGAGTSIDTRTESTNSNHRQVVVLGDPSVNDSIVAVQATDPASNVEGLVVRDVNTSAIVARLASTIGIYLNSTAGTIAVNVGTIAGTTAIYLHSTAGTIGVNIGTIAGTTAVYLHSTAGTIVTFAQPLGTAAISAKDGTFAVYFSPSRPVVLADNQHTSSIFTTSGSSSAVSVSGLTLVSPSANYSFKVFAIALSTTAQVHVTPKFTNGAGTSPTEYWRYGLQAPAQGVAGANLAVAPPGFLFQTGTSTTLSLVLDTASLVHYSVSYIKESS